MIETPANMDVPTGGAVEEQTPLDQLSEAAKKAIIDLLKSCLDSDREARREEVRLAWKLRLYCMGRQQNWWDNTSFLYMTPESSGFEVPRNMKVFDITTPHKRSFVSILSENPPGVNFTPNDLQRGADVTAAKIAEKMRLHVDRLVQMKERQAKAAGYFCTDGRVVSWTRLDGESLRITMHGVLESKVPIFAQNKEDWDYCILSKEQNIWRAKSENPDFANEITASENITAESSYERFARLNIVSKRKGGSADSFKNLVTEYNGWITPWRYEKLPDEVQEEVEGLFPDGMYLRSYGDVLVDVQAQTMDCLAVDFPVDGEGQSRPALLNGVPDIQDIYNDIKNMQREAAEYGIPATWFDLSAVDSEAVPEQRSEPGAMHGINPPTGKSVQECVFQETPAGISEQSVAMLADLKQDAEFTTGDFPALYGGDTPGQDTVGVNRLLNNQAKGQLGPAWAAIQRLFAKIYPFAITLVAQISGDNLAIEGASGQESFNPQSVLDGGFGCYPDQDSSFPETTADKRASLQSVLGQLGQSDTGASIVMQPDNLKLIKQYGGVPDLIIPGAEARDKQLREIDQLLKEEPVENSQDPQWMQAAQQAAAHGQQPPAPPMQPSVPIDADWDYHQPEFDKVQEWLSSDARFDEERKGNFAGIQNVKLHGAAHKAALQANSPKNQPKPASFTFSIPLTEPGAIAAVLADNGITTTPDAIATSQVPEQQKTAAETQNASASAEHHAAQGTHQTVLAVKEAHTPIGDLPGSPRNGLK